ncbi:hypothetical protein BHE74_00039998 [Ensete ventricosum]|nr:hypothetical protein BHE74_00039998 [Ensete ventricosum]
MGGNYLMDAGNKGLLVTPEEGRLEVKLPFRCERGDDAGGGLPPRRLKNRAPPVAKQLLELRTTRLHEHK